MPCAFLLGMLFLKVIECQNYKPLSNVLKSKANENNKYNEIDFNRMESENAFDNQAERQTILPRVSKTKFAKNVGASKWQVDNG